MSNLKTQITKLKTNKGFTLVEAILALSVLIIGVLGVLQMFPAGLSLSKVSKNETMAVNLAQAKIEEKLLQDYETLADEDRAKVSTDSGSPFYNFEREVKIDILVGDSADGDLDEADFSPIGTDEGLKRITVTVYWLEKGAEQKVTVYSLKAK